MLRAGGGRFITRLGVSDSVFLGGNPPFQPNASVSFGSVDNPGAGGAASIPLVVTTQSKAFKNPEAWNWNLTFERQMFWKSLLSVGYVGRRGLHLQREADINQPTTAVVTAPANAGVNINALRPYKGFGSIRETDNVATSRYDSLQVAWNRRFANGLLRGLARKQVARPPATDGGLPPVKEQVIHFVNKKLPGGLPKKTARALLDIEDKDYVPIIRDPAAFRSSRQAYPVALRDRMTTPAWAWTPTLGVA